MKTKLTIIITLVLLIGFACPSFAQTVKGYVYDSKTEEPLVGVSVFHKDKGTITDINGYYELKTLDESSILTFTYLGYETQIHPLVLSKGQVTDLSVYLKIQTNLIDEVVVSAGRYEQKISEITVSMEVLKANDIAKQNATDLSVVLNTLPGVDITDKQPSIRGGSGWTYGVGSRSLVLVDGMSVLSPGVGEVNWNVIPMENVDQVEVIKGASSVLYGSSALNGLINVLTKRPNLEPQTNINTYLGVYLKPENESYAYWDENFWHEGKFAVEPIGRGSLFSGIRNPIYTGIDVSHARRIGNWDVSGGLDLFTNEGYRADDYNQRVRFGGNLTYHDPDCKGMNYGLNVNVLSNNYSGFFIWRSAEQPYMQSPMTNMSRQGNTFYIDPFLNYYNEANNTSHKIKSRYYYKSDQIISNSINKSAMDILTQMNFDVKTLPEIIEIARNPMNFASDLLSSFVQGDMKALSDKITAMGEHFFPGAKAPDYVELMSWMMARTPFPQDESEILPWLSNINKPKNNTAPADQTSSYYLDYQFNKKTDDLQFTAGLTFDHVSNESPVTGSHRSDNIGAYFQYDQKFFDKLNVSLGARFEYYRVDSLYKEAETNYFGMKMPFKPVFRAGLNYELTPFTFLRASFGQGYRYPSITEKFVYKDIGGIAAFPNNNLRPESGFNTELGVKQGYKIGNFMGYVDLAGFYTYYKDMIEFQFGLFNKSTFNYIDNLAEVIGMAMNGHISDLGLGTRFANVDRAKIYGLDFSINGLCNIASDTKLTYSLGYVYIEPIDADWKAKKVNQSNDPLDMKEKSNDSKYLKYRQKHSFKGVFDIQWNRLDLGTNLTYKTKTLAVDYFLVDERDKAQPDVMDLVRKLIFPGLHDYWMEHNTGYFAMDVRLGVKITKNVQVWGMLNNFLNTEYTLRPMDVSPPRTFVCQVNAKF